MNGETRLERLLRRETDTYRPAADGFERIRARMRVRRRRKVARRAGAGMLTVAVVAAGVVVVTTGGHRPNGSTTVAVGGGPSSTAIRGPGVLVSVTQRRVEWLSPTDGHVLRTVPIRLPGSRPVGQIAATPSGSTVYVTVVEPSVGASGCGDRIVAIDTATGAEYTVATDASAPAVNASGTALAYLASEGPTLGATSNCVARGVVVQPLVGDRKRRAWSTGTTQKMGLDRQQLLTLSWAPTGPDLLVGSEWGPESGIQVIDTDQPAGIHNPTALRPTDWGTHRGLYADPVEEADGTLLAVATTCSGTTSCARGPAQDIDIVNRQTGHLLKVLATPKRVTGLVADPTGDETLAEVPVNRSATTLRLLLVGRRGARSMATVNGPVAWVTGAVPTSPPSTTAPGPTTQSSPTTQAAQVVATLHLSSHVIPPGGKLRATITVDNRTGHALHDSGCGTLFEVVLGNAAHPNVPAQLTCIRGYTIRPGVPTYHLDALTTYATCEVHGHPRCGRTSPPPLPPGEYRAKVYEQGHAVPVPAAQEVRVRAR